MPCRDIREVLELQLDQDERVLTYTLSKRTCGAWVGTPSIMARELGTLTAAEVVDLKPAGLTDLDSEVSELDFLRIKHLFAVQACLESYHGHAPAGPGGLCSLASVAVDDQRITIRAIIDGIALQREIAACGNCGRKVSKKAVDVEKSG